MDFVYDFVESIHVFIPIIAVVSLILIVYFCGIGRPQQPPEDYIAKIQQIQTSSRQRKQNKAKPSKFVAPSKSSDDETPSSRETLRQRRISNRGEEQSTRRSTEGGKSEELAPPAPEGEWVTVTPKRKGRKRGEEEHSSPDNNSPTSAEEEKRVDDSVPKPISPSKKGKKSALPTATTQSSIVEPEKLEEQEKEVEEPVVKTTPKKSPSKKVKPTQKAAPHTEMDEGKSDSNDGNEKEKVVRSPKKVQPMKEEKTVVEEVLDDGWQTQPAKKGKSKGKKKDKKEESGVESTPASSSFGGDSYSSTDHGIASSSNRTDKDDRSSKGSWSWGEEKSNVVDKLSSAMKEVEMDGTGEEDEMSLRVEEDNDVVLVHQEHIPPQVEEEEVSEGEGEEGRRKEEKKKKKKKKKTKGDTSKPEPDSNGDDEEVEPLDASLAKGSTSPEEENDGFTLPKKPSRPRARRI